MDMVDNEDNEHNDNEDNDSKDNLNKDNDNEDNNEHDDNDTKKTATNTTTTKISTCHASDPCLPCLGIISWTFLEHLVLFGNPLLILNTIPNSNLINLFIS